eukprot:8392377-Alexandrium_andersonii.AAC.1
MCIRDRHWSSSRSDCSVLWSQALPTLALALSLDGQTARACMRTCARVLDGAHVCHPALMEPARPLISGLGPPT